MGVLDTRAPSHAYAEIGCDAMSCAQADPPAHVIIGALKTNIYDEMIEMSEVAQREVDTLKVRSNQMVFSIPSEEDGVDEILYVDSATDTRFSKQPVNLGGAWAGLVDGDELLESIEKSGRETPPSEPLYL